MQDIFPTKLVQKLTGSTFNQLKYWVRISLVSPERVGKSSFYSFKDIVKLRILVTLRKTGLSLQKVRKGINNLTAILPDDEPLTRLRDEDEITSPFVHLIFRPSLPDLQTQNPQNSSTIPAVLRFQVEQI